MLLLMKLWRDFGYFVKMVKFHLKSDEAQFLSIVRFYLAIYPRATHVSLKLHNGVKKEASACHLKGGKTLENLGPEPVEMQISILETSRYYRTIANDLEARGEEHCLLISKFIGIIGVASISVKREKYYDTSRKDGYTNVDCITITFTKHRW